MGGCRVFIDIRRWWNGMRRGGILGGLGWMGGRVLFGSEKWRRENMFVRVVDRISAEGSWWEKVNCLNIKTLEPQVLPLSPVLRIQITKQPKRQAYLYSLTPPLSPRFPLIYLSNNTTIPTPPSIPKLNKPPHLSPNMFTIRPPPPLPPPSPPPFPPPLGSPPPAQPALTGWASQAL